MNAWKRDGRKRWSSWDQLSYAALAADERHRTARRKQATPEERGQRRWNQILLVIALVALVCVIAYLGIRNGRKSLDGIMVAVFVCAGAVIVAAPTSGDPRDLIRLRRDRVRQADELARLTKSPHDEGTFADLHAKLIERRTLRAQQLRQRAGCMSGIVMARAHPESAKCATLALMSFWGGQPVSRMFESRLPPLSFLAVLLPFILGAAAALLYRRARRRLLQAIEGSACPDCGYPLANIPPRVAPPTGQSETIGPERCPECGCPWPLVPPKPPSLAATLA